MAKSRFGSAAGYSTVEILTAVAVGLLITSGFVSFNHFQIRALHDQVSQIQLQNTDRSVIDLFAREVRRAGTNPTCAAGITALSDLTAHQIRIQADLNGNGALDAVNEDVTYRYVAATNRLERVTGGVTEVLFSGLDPTGSALKYYDASGTELVPDPSLTSAQAASVRRLRFELKLSDTGYHSETYGTKLVAAAATDINLRNRFFVGSVACP